MVKTNEKYHGKCNLSISTVVMNYLKKQRVRNRAAISLPEFALFSRRSLVCAMLNIFVREFISMRALFAPLFTFTLAISRPFEKLLAFNNPYLTVALSLTSFVIRSVSASASVRIPHVPCCSSVCLFLRETNLHGRFSRQRVSADL